MKVFGSAFYRAFGGRRRQVLAQTVSDGSLASDEYADVAVVFVCQAGEWELKALLLAASLRQWCGARLELIAAVPHPIEQWGQLAGSTRQGLANLGVRVEPIFNPLGPEFSHGNKISCLRVPTARKTLVFLDSDILCLGKPAFSNPGRFGIAMKVADALAFENDAENWESIYSVCGVKVPEARYPMSTSSQYSFPFFNSGVIVLRSDLAGRLADAWERNSHTIRSAEHLHGRRLWSDQLGLAVTIEQLSLTPLGLDLRQNHPTHIMPLSSCADVRLSHYHWPRIIREEPVLIAAVQDCVARLPAISAVIAAQPEWAPILQRKGRRTSASKPDASHKTLLITGISRSGTSYLCQLVDRMSNAVGLNETPDLVTALKNSDTAWGLPQYLRGVRREIIEGKPIANKVWKGEVISDTAIRDALSTYAPSVENEDFILAAKNTFAFLSSLSRVRRVLPNARIAICIRDPFDTIASWKTSFPHLLNADTSVRPVGHTDDPWISAVHRDKLFKIAETPILARRRAMLWRYLAERILEAGNSHLLVRYEDLVRDPAAQLERIFCDWDGGRPPPQSPDVRISSKRGALDDDDLVAIRAICSDIAAELGVWTE